jgi:hypothetical protein
VKAPINAIPSLTGKHPQHVDFSVTSSPNVHMQQQHGYFLPGFGILDFTLFLSDFFDISDMGLLSSIVLN